MGHRHFTSRNLIFQDNAEYAHGISTHLVSLSKIHYQYGIRHEGTSPWKLFLFAKYEKVAVLEYLFAYLSITCNHYLSQCLLTLQAVQRKIEYSTSEYH